MNTICFRDLENVSPTLGTKSALDGWYASVRTKPIWKFSVDDLCRACRQKLYLEYVVPVAISVLQEDTAAGYQYDGELASVLARIPGDFWQSHREQTKSTVGVLRTGLDNYDDDVKTEVQSFLSQFAD